ncbi:hypothetical protein [Streptomyces sp. NPDC002788]
MATESGWNGDWFPLSGQHIFDHQKQQIAAVSRNPEQLDLFVIGFDNKAYSRAARPVRHRLRQQGLLHLLERSDRAGASRD